MFKEATGQFVMGLGGERTQQLGRERRVREMKGAFRALGIC